MAAAVIPLCRSHCCHRRRFRGAYCWHHWFPWRTSAERGMDVGPPLDSSGSLGYTVHLSRADTPVDVPAWELEMIPCGHDSWGK